MINNCSSCNRLTYSYTLILFPCKNCPLYEYRNKGMVIYFDEKDGGMFCSCEDCKILYICEKCYHSDIFPVAYGNSSSIFFTKNFSHCNFEFLKNNKIVKKFQK